MNNSDSTEYNPASSWLSSTWSLATPPLAAAGAIVPTFYGFEVKSSQQLGTQWPCRTIPKALMGGLKASPVIGGIVGAQMVAQGQIEEYLAKRC